MKLATFASLEPFVVKGYRMTCALRRVKVQGAAVFSITAFNAGLAR